MSTLAERILAFANAHVGQRVRYSRRSRGECWDLAEKALEESGGQTSRQIMGRSGGNLNYVWGDAVTVNSISPGFIIQFRNFRNRIVKTKIFRDGSQEIETINTSRPHHTAIIKSVAPHQLIELLEQNILGNRNVAINTVYLTSDSWSINRGNYELQYEVTATGQFWIYRPRS